MSEEDRYNAVYEPEKHDVEGDPLPSGFRDEIDREESSMHAGDYPNSAIGAKLQKHRASQREDLGVRKNLLGGERGQAMLYSL